MIEETTTKPPEIKERLCGLCHKLVEIDDENKFKNHKIKVSKRTEYYCQNSGKYDPQSLTLPQR